MKMFEGTCNECGKKVYLTDPLSSGFCSRECEANFKWRKTSFGSTQKGHTWDREKVKKEE